MAGCDRWASWNASHLFVRVLRAAHITLFERPFDWNLNPPAYKSIRPVKCLTHFYLTVSSFLLAFLIWTNWSRCHSPPILTLSLAFHYRVSDCTEVWDKLVMSKVKLYPGLCNSIHLSKRRGGKLLKRKFSKLPLFAKRRIHKEGKLAPDCLPISGFDMSEEFFHCHSCIAWRGKEWFQNRKVKSLSAIIWQL